MHVPRNEVFDVERPAGDFESYEGHLSARRKAFTRRGAQAVPGKLRGPAVDRDLLAVPKDMPIGKVRDVQDHDAAFARRRK